MSWSMLNIYADVVLCQMLKASTCVRVDEVTVSVSTRREDFKEGRDTVHVKVTNSKPSGQMFAFHVGPDAAASADVAPALQHH